MRNRFLTVLGSAAVLILAGELTYAEEYKIIKVINAQGRPVYTNLVDNNPAPVAPVIAAQRRDRLADELPPLLNALVNSISAQHGVDAALVRAVMKTESNFDRWAVSHKGAQGLMQLIPETGRRFGVSDPFDPRQNIEGGVRYLKFLLEKFNGNLDLSLAAYNAGENLVARLGRIPAIRETTNYVRKVRAFYTKPPVVPANPIEEKLEAAPQPRQIYRTVDSRGVVQYSDIGPPNR